MPAVYVCGLSLLINILSFAGIKNYTHAPFWAGGLCYLVFQALFYRPMLVYVFGHELTHALAGILSGAKIKKFKVNKNSGLVVLNKDNIWITLSPYFFPLYSFIVILIYFSLGWVIDILQIYSYFIFFLGFTIAFHIALTVFIIRIGQPDLKVYGIFFSLIVILSANILTFSLLMILAFPREINAATLFSNYYESILGFYKPIFNELISLI
jgi:hypothetical protein